MDQPTRTCSVCDEAKPLEAFPSRGGKCRPCLAAQQREYRKANPEKFRAYEVARYERHGEQRKAEGRALYAANAEARREYARRYYYDNEPANYERNRARRRAQRLANPEKAAEYTRRYREKNPAILTTINQNRRTRIGGKKVTKAELDALWTGECALCREPIDTELKFPDPLSRSLDHIMPLAKGGEHVAANLQWAHFTCNRRKSDRVA